MSDEAKFFHRYWHSRFSGLLLEGAHLRHDRFGMIRMAQLDAIEKRIRFWAAKMKGSQ
jgi:hypothetical protein